MHPEVVLGHEIHASATSHENMPLRARKELELSGMWHYVGRLREECKIPLQGSAGKC